MRRHRLSLPAAENAPSAPDRQIFTRDAHYRRGYGAIKLIQNVKLVETDRG